jgi:hypothetical protein
VTTSGASYSKGIREASAAGALRVLLFVAPIVSAVPSAPATFSATVAVLWAVRPVLLLLLPIPLSGWRVIGRVGLRVFGLRLCGWLRRCGFGWRTAAVVDDYG